MEPVKLRAKPVSIEPVNKLSTKPVTSDLYDRIYCIVRSIPYGRVTSYGQVAILSGIPGAARVVGYALFALSRQPATDIPWQRVINRRGELSLRKLGEAGEVQRTLLEQEGIEFSKNERVDLDRFGWWG